MGGGLVRPISPEQHVGTFWELKRGGDHWRMDLMWRVGPVGECALNEVKGGGGFWGGVGWGG